MKALFPTLIHFEKLSFRQRAQLNRELLADIHTIQKLDLEGRRWSKTNYVGGYTSYASQTQLHRTHHPFMVLSKAIDSHVRRYARQLHWDLKGGRLEMTTCWVNVMPKFSHHSLHLHPLAVVSGTYYVQTPKEGGTLKFEDPRIGLFMGSPPRKASAPKEVQPFYSLQPETGKIVLFESWIRHEVPANRGNEKRISISFNYEWV